MVDKKRIKKLRKTTGPENSSGISETTSDVVHNIKNVINPVLWDHVFLRQQYSSIRVDLMKQAFDELTTGQLQPKRREKLKAYLELTFDHIEFLQGNMDLRLDKMERRAKKVLKLLEDQSALNSTAQSHEPLTIEDIINEAISLTSTKGHDNADITIDVSIPDDINFIGNRVSMLYLFSNIIINAYKAIIKAGNYPGRISIFATEKSSAGQKFIHVRICDNGCGISPENLERIFERGFSTKNKKSGVGLHWCAKALRAVDGNIYAKSTGVGHGASINVLIPLKD